jgi:hypothetical protein
MPDLGIPREKERDSALSANLVGQFLKPKTLSEERPPDRCPVVYELIVIH